MLFRLVINDDDDDGDGDDDGDDDDDGGDSDDDDGIFYLILKLIYKYLLSLLFKLTNRAKKNYN